MSENKATLSFKNTSSELPIYTPTLGFDVVDVKGLGKQQLFTFDPGFFSTAACESKITFIDGGKGVLLYRGYPIDQLAAQKDYVDVCYLLVYGELPTTAQKTEFV